MEEMKPTPTDICPNCGTNSDYQTKCCLNYATQSEHVKILVKALEDHRKQFENVNHFSALSDSFGECSLCKSLAEYRKATEGK